MTTLMLGAAFRTINPALGLALIGYPKGRPNTGVGVDLCARVAVFGDSKTRKPSAAVVVLDTLGVTPQFVAGVRKLAAEKVAGLDPETVMVVATHTHSAPTLSFRQFGDGSEEATAAYAAQVTETIGETFADAWKNPVEVVMKVGRTEVKLGHNRRVVDEQGAATNVWLDLEAAHPGFYNPNVRILFFEEVATKKVRGVMSFYACHPVTGGPGNFKASADYPGFFVRAVEKALPGSVAIHITGAAAQINPRDGLFDDFEKSRLPGEILAAAVLKEAGFARAVEAMPVLVKSETLTLALAEGATSNYSKRAADSADGKTVTSEVQVIRLGEVAIISAPGELFGEIGLAIENSSPFETTLVAGYANDNLGYLVTDTARREGGYEPRNELSRESEAQVLLSSRRALSRAAGTTTATPTTT